MPPPLGLDNPHDLIDRSLTGRVLAGFDPRQGFLPDARQVGQSLLTQPRALPIPNQVAGQRIRAYCSAGNRPCLSGFGSAGISSSSRSPLRRPRGKAVILGLRQEDEPLALDFDPL